MLGVRTLTFLVGWGGILLPIMCTYISYSAGFSCSFLKLHTEGEPWRWGLTQQILEENRSPRPTQQLDSTADTTAGSVTGMSPCAYPVPGTCWVPGEETQVMTTGPVLEGFRVSGNSVINDSDGRKS